MRANFNPEGLIIHQLGMAGSFKSTQKVDSLTAVTSQIVGAKHLVAVILDNISEKSRDEGNSRLAKGNTLSNLGKALQDRLNLSRVESKRHLQLGRLEAFVTQGL